MAAARSSREHFILVGSYTSSYAAFRASGLGLTLLAFDAETGTPEPRGFLGDLANPSYVRWLSSDRAQVTLETTDAEAGLALIAVDDAAGLALLGRVGVQGAAPCHVDVHPSRKWVAAACYGSGHIVRAELDADGALAAPGLINLQSGSGTHPQRQTSSHPHAACFTRDGKFLIVPDLGTDELWCYELTGDMTAPRRWRAPSGSGPRLVLFSRDDRHLILVHELASTVSSLRWQDGEITTVTTASTLATGFSGANTAAGLRWHPSDEMFAVSNRGEDSIALFRFATHSGAITPLARAASGGVKPRDFDFSPCGRWLVAGNQDSDTLVVFRVDVAAGTLTAAGHAVTVASPSCVRFRPPATRSI